MNTHTISAKSATSTDGQRSVVYTYTCICTCCHMTCTCFCFVSWQRCITWTRSSTASATCPSCRLHPRSVCATPPCKRDHILLKNSGFINHFFLPVSGLGELGGWEWKCYGYIGGKHVTRPFCLFIFIIQHGQRFCLRITYMYAVMSELCSYITLCIQ